MLVPFFLLQKSTSDKSMWERLSGVMNGHAERMWSTSHYRWSRKMICPNHEHVHPEMGLQAIQVIVKTCPCKFCKFCLS